MSTTITFSVPMSNSPVYNDLFNEAADTDATRALRKHARATAAFLGDEHLANKYPNGPGGVPEMSDQDAEYYESRINWFVALSVAIAPRMQPPQAPIADNGNGDSFRAVGEDVGIAEDEVPADLFREVFAEFSKLDLSGKTTAEVNELVDRRIEEKLAARNMRTQAAPAPVAPAPVAPAPDASGSMSSILDELEKRGFSRDAIALQIAQDRVKR